MTALFLRMAALVLGGTSLLQAQEKPLAPPLGPRDCRLLMEAKTGQILLRQGPWTIEIADPRPAPLELGARYVHGGYIHGILRDGRRLTGRAKPQWNPIDGEGAPEVFEPDLAFAYAEEGDSYLRIGAGRVEFVSVDVTRAAPHHLVADSGVQGGLFRVRRTAGGDAWAALQDTAGSHRPAVTLGMPTIGRPPAAKVATGTCR